MPEAASGRTENPLGYGQKKRQIEYRAAQPLTLAPFRAWGSSVGAGRTDLPLQRYEHFLAEQVVFRLFSGNQAKNEDLQVK
ncbi:hypothetical protein TH61_13580 [Rufibacter sp. DG15C]|nr:hypothetical protein TH61_13580 [Rufibacter sp. DG15C]